MSDSVLLAYNNSIALQTVGHHKHPKYADLKIKNDSLQYILQKHS